MTHIIFVFLVATYGLGMVVSNRLLEKILPHLESCRSHRRMAAKHCIEALGSELREGVAVLDIPRFEPYYEVFQPYDYISNNVYVGSAKLRNIRIFGLSYYFVSDVKFNTIPRSDRQINFVIRYLNLGLTANCYLNGTFGSTINIKGDQLEMAVKDLVVNITIEGNYYYPLGEKYFRLYVVIVGVHSKGSFEINLQRKNVSSLSSEQKSYLHTYKDALWIQIVPDIRVAVAKFIRTIAEKMFDYFPVKDLFPS